VRSRITCAFGQIGLSASGQPGENKVLGIVDPGRCCKVVKDIMSFFINTGRAQNEFIILLSFVPSIKDKRKTRLMEILDSITGKRIIEG
jgi:hypothetical protein